MAYTKEKNHWKLFMDTLEALEWMDALFEAGDFRADHKQEALAVRRKVKAVIKRAQKVAGNA